MSDKSVALICKLHPGSTEKQRRVVSLLQAIVPFYHTPEAKCTTWCYLTPSKRAGALSPFPGGEKDAKSRHKPVVIGVEVYTDKSSLSTQLADPVYFQPFQKTVATEKLYDKPEELVAWYPVGGFLSRGPEPVHHEPGMVVIIGEGVCKEGSRDLVLSAMERLASWVIANEPDTLSYSIMTRPKAPNEIFVFERYRNSSSMLRHLATKEVRKLFSAVEAGTSSVQISEWEEVGASFVAELPTAKRLTKSATKL